MLADSVETNRSQEQIRDASVADEEKAKLEAGQSGTEVLIGRQPILDRVQKTVAYELLFRSRNTNRYEGTDGDAATDVVIANTFLNIGVNRVLGGKRGFINFTEELLLSGRGLLLPPDRVVVEVLETVQPNAAVVDACKTLKTAGFCIALDDVSSYRAVAPLLPYADYAKIDLVLVSRAERGALCRYFRCRGIRVLAEKVETRGDFQTALDDGCELFQGYFFARPEIVSARHIPSSKLNCLRLMREIHQPDLDFERLTKVVRLDIGLAQKLLSFVNSAAFGLNRRIDCISQAFIVLGERNIRKWVTLAALPTLAAGGPTELITESLVRARFAELATERLIGNTFRPAASFLIGLLSLLDSMMGRPLDEILAEMALDRSVTDVLLGLAGANRQQRAIIALAVAFERSDFDSVADLASEHGFPVMKLSELYHEAIHWAEALPQ